MPYMIDPRTGKKIEIDPVTGQPIQQTSATQGMDVKSKGIFREDARATRRYAVPETGVKALDKTMRFGENIQYDVEETILGLSKLPKYAKQKVKEKGFIGGIADIGKDLITGTIDEYANLLKDPKKQMYERPVSTVLDLLPFVQFAKSKALTNVKNVASSADDVTRIASGVADVADEPGKIKIAPFKKSYDPDIVAKAKSVGVEDLPVSAQTSSRVVKGSEALVQKGFFGSKVATEFDDALRSVSDKSDDLISKIDKASDPKAVGNIIKKGFDDFENTFNETKTKLYDDVKSPELDVAKVDLTDTRNTLTEIIEQKSQSAAPDVTASYYQEMLDNLNGKEKLTRVIDDAYRNTVDNGGVTINLEGNMPGKGYAYSKYKGIETVVPKESFAPNFIDDFIAKNSKLLDEPGNHLGLWEEDGKIYIDVSTVGEAVPNTITEAEKLGQLAVFDLENFETIYTELGKQNEKINITNINKGEIPKESVKGVVGELPEVSKGGAKVQAPRTATGLSYQTLKQTRTSIGQKLKNRIDPVTTGDRASLERLYAAVSNDLDNTIKTANPRSYEALKVANQYYGDTINKLNSDIGRRIANSDPEKLVNDLVKPNSETAIIQVKEIVGPEATAKLQTSFVEKLINESLDKNGHLDTYKLNRNITKYSESTIGELLTKEQFTNLKTIQQKSSILSDVEKALKAGAKPATGSQTAFLTRGTAYTAGIFVNPGLTIKAILGEYALSKLFTTKAGKQLMTTGLEFAKPNINAPSPAMFTPAVPVASNIPAPSAQTAFSSGEAPFSAAPQAPTAPTAGTTQPDIATPTTPSGGMITIKNSKTGEVKSVNQAELGSYGLSEGGPSGQNIPTKREMLQKAAEEGANLKQLKEISEYYDLVVGDEGVLNAEVQEATTGLREEYFKRTQENSYLEIVNSYGKVLSSPDTAAGDVSLIFAYMKMLDPGSVVREGEFANAENTAGIPDRIMNAYNKAVSGKRLGSRQRADFTNASEQVFKQHKTEQEKIDKFYSNLAKKYGVSPELIGVGTYGESSGTNFSGGKPAF